MPTDDSNHAIRNEGVGIALDEKATIAWKDGGEKWCAVSSRIITARLRVMSKGQRKPGGSREVSNIFMTILSVYAPTAKAPPSVKLKFSQDLQDTLNLVPQSDVLVVLGDFNARVGKRDRNSNLWKETLGYHGLDERNDAGEEFLEFCTTNHLSVMNTMSYFQKKDIHLGTWMHPATKRFHMIDYVVMRTNQRKFCNDVQVMRGANCWSDHQMVHAKLTVKLPKLQQKKRPVPFASTHLVIPK